MMTFKEYLIERYVTIHPDKTPDYENVKHQFVKDNWHHIQKSYEKMGGFAAASTPEELAKDLHTIKAVKRNGKIVAGTGYKDSHGRKATVAFTDSSDEGRRGYREIAGEDHKMKRAWAEKSGPAAKVADKLGVPKVSNQHAEKLTGKKIISKDPDGTSYERVIGDKVHKKTIYGHPKGI